MGNSGSKVGSWVKASQSLKPNGIRAPPLYGFEAFSRHEIFRHVNLSNPNSLREIGCIKPTEFKCIFAVQTSDSCLCGYSSNTLSVD